VKDINLHDVAFQKYCYEGAGLKIRKCFLLHLNSYYIRKGKINIKKLFVKDDITEQVKDLENETKVNILALSETINSKKYPEATIGPRCKSPYQCPLTECWDFLPENHVFHLYRGGKKSLDLFESGVHAIHEIPEDTKLTDRQGIQKKCEDSGEIHIDKKNIKRFLDGLKYPLYYLDFETFSTAVPMFDGSKTYQNIPFQYSLHVVEKEGAKPKHFEYLYSGKGDPRKDFISNLVKVMGQTGSVIVYNESFEIGRLKELSLEFPQHSKDIINIIGRVVDLLTPFRNFHYYNPKQKGSASIKKVLPALTEGKKGYEGMDIADGAVASVEYYYMTYKNGKDVRESLLEYCGLDTMAEVWIVGKLKEVL